jgi:hypothetical protein
LEDDARESPPVDPQNASFVRPNRIHPPPNMNLRDFGRAKKNTVEGNANGNGSRKSRISSINSNQDANQSTSSVRGAANNVRSSYGKVDDQKG